MLAREMVFWIGVRNRGVGVIWWRMRVFLMILLGVDLVAVVAVMLFGAIGMAMPGRSPQTSNKLMRLRVGLQGVGVALVVVLMLTGGR